MIMYGYRLETEYRRTGPAVMEWDKLLAELRGLSRADKLRLIRLLLRELEQDSSGPLPLDEQYRTWKLQDDTRTTPGSNDLNSRKEKP
jgi:hypothetical protein